MRNLITEEIREATGIAPAADAFAGTVTSDYVRLDKFGRLLATIVKGVGTAGTSTITVLAASDSSGTGATAITFYYREETTLGTIGDATLATTSGFTTTAGSNQRYYVEVKSDQCPADKPWVAIKAVEVANDPVAGSIELKLADARYGCDVSPIA